MSLPVKNKNKYLPLFWIAFSIIVLLNLLLWLYVNQLEDQFKKTLSGHLETINRTIEQTIETEYLRAIDPEQKNSLEYFSTLQQLENIRSVEALQSIQIFNVYGQLLISAPEVISSIEPPYLAAEADNPYHTQALEGKATVGEAIKIAGLWYLASYAPLYDIDQNLMGIIKIEVNAAYFSSMENLRQQLLIFSILNLLIILIIAFFLLRMIRNTIRYQETIKDQEHLAQLGTMGANVAHELRNPLGIIEGSNALIKKKYGKDDDEIFDYIPSEIERLKIIIEDFLRFARTPEIQVSRFSLNALFLKIKVGIAAKDLAKIKIDISPPDLHISSDENLIEQALLNLIKNSLEAINELDNAHVEVSLFKQKNRVHLYIKDNGIGINEKDLQSIFRPFFTTKQKGTGLGLAITKRLIHLLEGTIKIDSTLGVGTTVKMSLPMTYGKGK